MRPASEFSPPLDEGITRAVLVLDDAGIETFESCQGGPGTPTSSRRCSFTELRLRDGMRSVCASTSGCKCSAKKDLACPRRL
jgi:hypothetical protein